MRFEYSSCLVKTQKLIPLVVIVAGLLAYSDSFTGAFLRDDGQWIEGNPRVHHLSLVNVVSGTSRPVVQLSLALNYAVGGLDVCGYHLFNLVVHVLAGLTLYGIVRRTLVGERLRSRYAQPAAGLALAMAVLWLLHPLQTESVTYIIQRAESMMGLFYFLTLYCVIRGAEPADGRLWYPAAVLACALGMASKPVMVTAPLMILLYDRAFLTNSFREALRRRGWLYSGLAATWALLPVLLRNGSAEWKTTAGFAYQGVRPSEYALTQPGVILHYLRLSVWPHPLLLSHGWPVAKSWMSILPPTVVVAILVAATAWAWRRHPACGFVGAWFFLILAPTSSFIPLYDLIYEHRMYLPLAAVVSVVVLGLYSLAGRQSFAAFVVMATGLGFLTWRRNQDYRSEIAMRSSAVAAFPDDALEHYNLGIALTKAGHVQEAISQYEQTLRLNPDIAGVRNNLGVALEHEGRVPEAIRYYEQAVYLTPDDAEAHNNLGSALARLGRVSEAIGQWERALALRPDYPEAHYNWGVALAQLNRLPEAMDHWEKALQIKPDYVDAHNNLGAALLRTGQVQEAILHFEEALRLKPDLAETHYNLGVAMEQAGRVKEAIGQYEQVLRLKPDYAAAQNRLMQLRAVQ